MRVIDVRSFDIPSDENDYDELVAFADTMACIPQFDAVPVEVLDKIRSEIKSLERFEIRGEVTPLVNVNRVLEIINKAEMENT